MDYILDNISVPFERLLNNSIKSFEGMTAQRWVRLAAVIGGYMLLRPWLLKFAADRQKAQFEKESEELGLGTGTTANDLRGGKPKKPMPVPSSSAPTPAGKVLGEIKDDEVKTRKRKPAQKKMLEQEEADEEQDLRQFLDEQRRGLE